VQGSGEFRVAKKLTVGKKGSSRTELQQMANGEKIKERLFRTEGMQSRLKTFNEKP
jgi:hypothetical protein